MFYFSWLGNKRAEIKFIEDSIEKLIDSGKVDKIVEPFCGSCAFSFHFYKKYGNKLNYYVNDSDENLISFLKAVKKNGSKPFFDHINKISRGMDRKEFDRVVNKGEPRNLKDWVFSQKVYGIRKYLFPVRPFGNYDHTKYSELDEFFKSSNVHISNHDYKKTFARFESDPKALFFIDPPYLDSFNAYYNQFKEAVDGRNVINDNTQMYIDILELMYEKCKVVSIQNYVGIIAHVYKKFFRGSYAKTYQLTKKSTRHAVFSNFKLKLAED